MAEDGPAEHEEDEYGEEPFEDEKDNEDPFEEKDEFEESKEGQGLPTLEDDTFEEDTKEAESAPGGSPLTEEAPVHTEESAPKDSEEAPEQPKTEEAAAESAPVEPEAVEPSQEAVEPVDQPEEPEQHDTAVLHSQEPVEEAEEHAGFDATNGPAAAETYEEPEELQPYPTGGASEWQALVTEEDLRVQSAPQLGDHDLQAAVDQAHDLDTADQTQQPSKSSARWVPASLGKSSSPAPKPAALKQSSVPADNPLRRKLIYKPLVLDKHGNPRAPVRYPAHPQEWNTRHHLLINKRGETMADNQSLPRSLRRYFSAPQNLSELKNHLANTPSSKTMLKKFELPEIPKPTSPLSADVGPPICPERYGIGGAMIDRDRRMRTWNDRWNRSVSQLNDHLHPLHRKYFVENSVFEVSPSQQWRRFQFQEAPDGSWMPIAQERPPLFPPLGA